MSSSPNKPDWSQKTSVHLIVMAILLLFLFRDSFKDGYVHFSNDSPLGGQVAGWDGLISQTKGAWQPLYWFGNKLIPNRPTVTLGAEVLIDTLGGDAITFQKFAPPIALWILGACSLFCFRQLGMRPHVALIAAVAAMLNMSAFSNACWGLPYWAVSRAMAFLAIGFAFSGWIQRKWMRFILAGACVGMGVMEGYDMGAIFSVFVAMIVFARIALEPSSEAAEPKPEAEETRSEKPSPRNAGQGLLAVGVMAATAAIIATHAIVSLVSTQIKGVEGAKQDKETRDAQYSFATQWSLPKKEMLRFVIPGLFGYRMDEPEGGQYWGGVGESPRVAEIREWAETNPQAQAQLQNPMLHRYSGSGEHFGIVVAIFAFWALAISFSKQEDSYSITERRFIWCLGGLALLSLLLAFGRHFPVYRLFYEMPYASTIRNPIKFTQPMHLLIGILFAYGLNDLWRRFVDKPEDSEASKSSLVGWLKTREGFARLWFQGCLAVSVVFMLGLLMFVSKQSGVVAHLTDTAIAKEVANKVFSFAVGEYVLFLIFLVGTLAFHAFALKGRFRGGRATQAMLVLLALVSIELGRSNAYWIRHVNYKEAYASNPLFKKLEENALNGRVTTVPVPGVQAMGVLDQLYQVNWLHKQFQYYRIQSLDIAQEPRVGADKTAYMSAIQKNPTRYWELGSARYLLGLNKVPTQQGPVEFVNMLNQQLDPQKNRFKSTMGFQIFQEPDDPSIKLREDTEGQYALLEFEGALPKARLFHQWRTIEDDAQMLQALLAPDFDPTSILLLSSQVAPSEQPDATGSVTIDHYGNENVKLSTQSPARSILLLNDRYHPEWKVLVDGKEAPILRANFIARGVELPPGDHSVEFRFSPSTRPLWVSLAGIVATLGLLCFLVVEQRKTVPAPSRKQGKGGKGGKKG